MNRFASRRLPVRHSFAAAAALTLGVFAAAPAKADCGAGPITMSTGAGPSYTCTRNCTVTGGARVIADVVFGPTATVSQCLDECTRTLGCTQISYSTTVEMRDGVPLVRMRCVLLGAGDAATMDVPPATGRATGVCTRDPSPILRHPGLEIDTNVRRDSFRPTIPIQLPIPTSPSKQ